MVSEVEEADAEDVRAEATEVIDRYGLEAPYIENLGAGLINDTFLVTAGGAEQYVLQRLNRVFPPEINLDIDALTRHLAGLGMPTQRLVTTKEPEPRLWVEHAGRIWRLSTYVRGDCFESLRDAAQAREAGRLLGRFHRGAGTLDIELHNRRLGVHDTARHLAALETALEKHTGHRNFPAVSALAHAIFEAAKQLPVLPALPDRLVHGDPKISNLVFDPASGEGLCMIDLDTLARMPLPLEMGDAFRSWCNPRGEDARKGAFRLDLFAGAVEGYAGEMAGKVRADEWRSFVPAIRTIILELAARFAADALNESYFGWNPEQFDDRSEHNQVRAQGQLNLYRAFGAHAAEAEAIVEAAFG